MKSALILVAASALAWSLPAAAQFQKPEDAVKYRQSVMTVQAFHLGRIGAMANGRIPFDAKVAQDNAAVLETVSRLAWAGYWAAAGFTDTLLRWKMKPEVVHGEKKDIQPRVQA